jgi:hypothetical protein
MLEVIENIFLQHGVKVILVPHSPTTIALAPEESIFVMNHSELNRIEKKSKQIALTVLTQGFATIGQGLKLSNQGSDLPPIKRPTRKVRLSGSFNYVDKEKTLGKKAFYA